MKYIFFLSFLLSIKCFSQDTLAVSDLKNSAKLLDVNFTDKEIEMMYPDIKDNLAEYKKMMIDNLISSHKDIFDWATKQSYIALGNLMTTASLLDIDSCPIEGINPEKYDEILGISNSKYATICVCALGFRSVEDKYQNLKKVRFEHDFLLKKI